MTDYLPISLSFSTADSQLVMARVQIDYLHSRIEEKEREIVRLQKMIEGMAARIAAQSELLSKRAEKRIDGN